MARTKKDGTLTKLASVLAIAKQNTLKDGVLTVVDGNKRKSRKFLKKIFVNETFLDNGYFCEYQCPLDNYNRGLLLPEENNRLILNYAASLGIASQATVESCRQCNGRSFKLPLGHTRIQQTAQKARSQISNPDD